MLFCSSIEANLRTVCILMRVCHKLLSLDMNRMHLINGTVSCRRPQHSKMLHSKDVKVCTIAFEIFTTRCYASAVLAMAQCPSVCLSVRHNPEFYYNG